MNTITDRLRVALVLSVFVPIAVQATMIANFADWVLARWTFVVALLTIAYLIIEVSAQRLVSDIDKLLNALILIVIAALAASFLLLSTGGLVAESFVVVRERLLFAAVFMMLVCSMSLVLTLIVKQLFHVFLNLFSKSRHE